MLKRVSIQNFKSLKDVTLDLQPVNLLIGPNNSGKTNFLKALEFLYQFANNKVQVNSEIIFQKSVSHGLELKMQFFFENWNSYSRFLYDNFIIEKQSTSIDKYSLTNALSEEISYSIYKLVDEKSTRESLYIYLKGANIYKPDTNKISRPAPIGAGSETITGDASNLVAFLDYLLSEYRFSFNQIELDLERCIPEFVQINLQNIKSTEDLVRQFGNQTIKQVGLTNGQQNVKYWADELSEGTLYFLALLCIVNQPNPPKLLLLEEPERGIHPRRIREVMDFIFRLAEEKDIQIILTTHNEHVLDDFSTRPEAVFVFDKDEEGATYVRNLQTDIIELTNQRNRELGLDDIDLTTNLSENWLYGLLGGVPPIV